MEDRAVDEKAEGPLASEVLGIIKKKKKKTIKIFKRKKIKKTSCFSDPNNYNCL